MGRRRDVRGKVMRKSDLMKFGLICVVLISMLGGVAAVWETGEADALIDPAVEQACHNEVISRAPLGHRGVITYHYHEEGTKLGIASGGIEAQYAPNRWTEVGWTCRINPTNRDIARVEMTPSSGGQRMKAAASAFQ